VPLTPKAFDTLLALVQHGGKTVEKDDLMRLVWPDSVVEENNLNQSITALRKTLGDSRHESNFIATIPGIGYRFVADVRKVDVVPNSLECGDLSPLLQKRRQVGALQGVSEVARNSMPGAARVALFILIPLALIVAVYSLFVRQTQQVPHISSIAVLPLENLSHVPNEEYFADGITDALIGDLAKINELKVISRTSSMHYKGTKKSLPEIARELKVDAVVEGTVQRAGDRVLVRAQLIHAATDHHMWIKTYERDVSDIMNLQSEIAQTIAREIQIKISPAEQARFAPGRSVNPKALDHYLQGRYLYWNKRTEENLRLAINHFQTAIDQDPQYAVAYAAIADCYNALGSVQFGALPPIEARSLSEKAAVKALELDTNLAEAHNALGFVKHYNWNWDAAEQEFKRALELNPSYAAAHNGYASYLMSKGRVEESITASNRARELDPLSLSISVQRGFLLENARRYPEAIDQLNWVVALDQNHYQALWMLSHTYAANGDVDKAIAAAEKSVAVSERTPGALGILGMIYGFAGRKAEAMKILNELRGLTGQRYVTPAALAYVYIGLGDKDRAFEWIEKAYQERSNFIAYLKVVPLVDSLRSDPRFPKLIERVGLRH
jgi:TolB-like protein/Flp pilus assembly protein TadD